MKAKLQLRIQRYGWDEAASVYEGEWRQHLAPAQRALLEISDLKPGMKVIETASGTGLMTFPAAEAVGMKGSILATDLSGEMVKAGNQTADKLGLSNTTFQQMNAEALDYEDDIFDRAMCALGLMYMPDPLSALKEMKRVLRPGGLASVAVWGERRNCGWADIFSVVDAHVHSEVCPLFFGLGSAGALTSDFKAAGFNNIQERRIESILSFDSTEQLLSAMIDGGAVALAAKRFDQVTRKSVEKEFLESVTTFRNGDRYEIPGEFVIASGVA